MSNKKTRQFAVHYEHTMITHTLCSILGALGETSSLLKDLKTLNRDAWTVRYPSLKQHLTASPPSNQQRPPARTSLTFADDPLKEIDVDMAPTRGTMRRSLTLAAIPDDSTEAEPQANRSTEEYSEPEAEDGSEGLIPAEFQILRLDLKLGPHGSSTSPGGLVSQLEKASIANLIDQRIGHSLSHIDKLRLRVEDTSSKVLVTGDLNAGKSTFVNALLGRDVMPVDQQPCTTMFCEVHDASENEGLEEAHVVGEGMTYNREDEATYTRATLAELEGIVSESDAQHILKLYVKDARNPSQSLLNNGVVDISLIDAPGLNRDSLGTTEIFARQEEIDVVVFVVNAENHFTLSAKEFLFNASNEKAYIFVVVNKFDHIRDKAKCKRMVLDQIKQLSPRTWEDAEDLVHFVDSSSALARAAFPEAESSKSSVPPETFDKMEAALQSFVLVKRAKSKLLPATTYLANILSDIDLLVSTNRILANEELQLAMQMLERAMPVLERMKRGRQDFEDGLTTEEEETAQGAYDHALRVLERALEKVGQGEIAVDPEMVDAPSSRQTKVLPEMPSYPGLLHVWDYAAQVRRALLSSLDMAVALVEDEARSLTANGVERVFNLAEGHLPADVDRTRRIFCPEAMFAPRRNGRAVVAGGTHGLGIGLASRPDLLEPSIVDILALKHHLPKIMDDDEDSHSIWGYVSLGLGAITMVGGKTVGLRGVIEGLAQIGDIFGNERSRRWAAPLLYIATIGLGVYVVVELPKTIPRSIGRQIKASLAAHHEPSSALVTPTPSFAVGHALRVQKETRKVMRLAGWDSKEKFRMAMEDTSKQVRGAEESKVRANQAIEKFDDFDTRTDAVRVKAGLTSY